jgi:hypothetical protein
MNFIPQVETQELSDSDLDNVSGGLMGASVGANATGFANSMVPVSGIAGTLVGTVEGATGLNTAPIAGIASATIAGV